MGHPETSKSGTIKLMIDDLKSGLNRSEENRKFINLLLTC